jgi:hypothetical protein
MDCLRTCLPKSEIERRLTELKREREAQEIVRKRARESRAVQRVLVKLSRR